MSIDKARLRSCFFDHAIERRVYHVSGNGHRSKPTSKFSNGRDKIVELLGLERIRGGLARLLYLLESVIEFALLTCDSLEGREECFVVAGEGYNCFGHFFPFWL